jgi:hypothetical protein
MPFDSFEARDAQCKILFCVKLGRGTKVRFLSSINSPLICCILGAREKLMAKNLIYTQRSKIKGSTVRAVGGRKQAIVIL